MQTSRDCRCIHLDDGHLVLLVREPARLCKRAQIVAIRFGYRSHLNRYGTDTGTWSSIPVPNGTFFRYFLNLYYSKRLNFNIVIYFTQ